MKSPLILSLLALAVSAVALTTLLVRRSGSEPRAAAPVEPEAAGDHEQLLARIDALSAETRELRDQLAAVALRREPAPRTPVVDAFVGRAEFDAFRDEVLAALLRRAPSSASVDMQPLQFQEQVATSLEQIRRDEVAEKIQAARADQVARLDQTVPKLQEWLTLTPQQSDRMRSALLARYEREAELARRWQDGEDPQVLGELKTNDRETLRTELSNFLTPHQLETYMNSRRGGAGK